MAALHTCRCGFVTRICRDEVTAEQWDTFLTFHRLAFDWAIRHLTSDDDPEAFAERYAAEHWDNDEPPSFPAQEASERHAAERRQAEQEAAERAERRAEARVKEARARSARRRAARRTLVRTPTDLEEARRGYR